MIPLERNKNEKKLKSKLWNFKNFRRFSPCDVNANVLNGDSVIKEFKLQVLHFVPFWANAHRKGVNHLFFQLLIKLYKYSTFIWLPLAFSKWHRLICQTKPMNSSLCLSKKEVNLQKNISVNQIHTHIHTHTHIYIYIYIYMCVCVCVCVYFIICLKHCTNYFMLLYLFRSHVFCSWHLNTQRDTMVMTPNIEF